MKRDLTGQRFGRWLVLKRDDSKTKYPYWICQCDCGKVVSVYGSSLTGGKSLSCGCRSSELKRAAHTTHGQYGTPLYKVYYGMLGRCYCKKHIDYKWYNQKGITVCDEWRCGFEAFREWAVQSGYKHGLTIDRIDNSKGYSPQNCRWATPKEQAQNRTTNLNYTLDGKTQCLKQWAEEFGVNYRTLYYRVRTRNIPLAKALEL